MKILAVISLTAFLCCFGVECAEQPDLEQQILNSGTVVFLDFLEKVRNATERFIQDDGFRKSRVTVQEHIKALREFAGTMRNSDKAEGSQDNSEIPLQGFVQFAVEKLGQMSRKVFDNFFVRYINIYRETLKNGTITDIWKEVDSYYLPGAPPMSSKPMEFLSYLLAKGVVRSQMVNMVEAGVNTLVVLGQINFNQLHEEMLILLDQVKIKASEISNLERQEEKNVFLVSLRTLSGLIVFYWDKVLENTENPIFDAIYFDSVKQWNELIQLRNTSETYHVLLNPDTRQSLLNWTKLHLSEFLDAVSEEYYSRGNKALGLERFNKSHWAVVKISVVYSIPVYEQLSEVGFGFTEINSLLNRANNIILTLEDHNFSAKETFLESCIRFILHVLGGVFKDEIAANKEHQLLLPLRVMRRVVLGFWWFSPYYYRYANKTELLQTESEWNHMKSSIIDELVKTKVFTREELEEAPDNFVQAIRLILEKLKQHTDLADGFEEKIDPTIVGLKRSMFKTKTELLEFWDLLLE